jgi:hypothetical protein
MEKLALDSAQAAGKLAALWDLVMERVPEKDRESNPFAEEKKT